VYFEQQIMATPIKSDNGGNKVNTNEAIILKGIPASPGKIKGKVKILMDPKEIEKMDKDYILVAPETNPEYTPAMLKASGIITDRGGILSHSAIVARELGIPCVVGTWKATQVLNDDMEITIDGDNGYVLK
jgi:pyruvate,water dikinase